MRFYLDTEKMGLETILTPHEAEVLLYIYNDPGKTSREVHEHLLERGIKLSRAMTIQDLKKFKSYGWFYSLEESCKGGYRPRYYPGYSLEELAMEIGIMFGLVFNEIKEGLRL